MSSKNPLVSVIMSVYNAESTLKVAIDSIVAQTYENWQFVICNDCSTDSTLNILKQYEEQYPDKFLIISNDINRRLSYSLNRCIEKSKGELIARMDGDDISRPDRLARQVQFLSDHPEYQLVGTSMRRFNDEGSYDVVACTEIPSKEELRYGVTFCHATIMTYKYVYEALGGYTEADYTQRSQDYDLWFKFFSKGYKGYNLADDLYMVREDLNAIKRRNLMDRKCILRIQLKGYKRLGFPFIWYITPFVQFSKILVPYRIIELQRKMQFGSSAK